MTDRQEDITKSESFNLWHSWTVTMAAIILVLAFGLLVPKTWMPVVLCIIATVLARIKRYVSVLSSGKMSMVADIGVLTMGWTAGIMVIILIVNSRHLLDGWIDWSKSNKDIPYITGLIMFPAMLVISVYKLLTTRIKIGEQLTRDNVRIAMIAHEIRYQLLLIICISAAISVLQYWYYFRYYFNTNLNNPDRFFFNYVPMVVAGLSIFIIARRYAELPLFLNRVALAMPDESKHEMRCIVISGDYILLDKDASGHYDTPIVKRVPVEEAFDAQAVLTEQLKIAAPSYKHLYADKLFARSEHFAAFLTEEQRLACDAVGKWIVITEICKELRPEDISPILIAELGRLCSTGLTFKKYDLDGNRRYPIKGYSPPFRLSEIEKLDIDFEDRRWAEIARDNEDHFMYHTRRAIKQLFRRK